MPTLQIYTVATLPSAASKQGDVAYVSDSDRSGAYAGSIAVGGGTSNARVLSDGTNWRIHGSSGATTSGILTSTSLSTVDKVASVVLTNGNLTATAINDGAATFQSGRSLVGITAGQKRFFSLQPTVVPTAITSMAFGLATSSFAFAGFLGATFASAAMYGNDARILVNNGSIGAPVAWALNSVLDWAVDRSANLVWTRIGGGNWNNSGAANPTTGVGGFDISGIVGTVFPCYQLLGDAGGSGRVIFNFGATAYAFAAPSGFLSIQS